MIRLNMFLLLIVVFCALGVVTSQHKGRLAFQHLDAERSRAKMLDAEFDQLQLELSTWATKSRIEKIAQEKLKMRLPDPAKVTTLSHGGGER